MSSKLGNTLPLFVSVREWVGSVFTSGLHLILLKLKLNVGMPHRVNFTF